ncbi:FecCD family ABC transporter permease [Schaalia hyovaginalis]|uniref:FecCD family ABC transporter permease n=1 Tax=Schaalia hyovaginalis TaxID=29316 RepID=UPI001F332B40|nr:iron ABC transporter permease [Schaalia hyovaginalis]MCF2711250.1 iron ABC transporter permease [Schaalia hyovaginalis]
MNAAVLEARTGAPDVSDGAPAPAADAIRAGRARREARRRRVGAALLLALLVLAAVDLAWGERWYAVMEVFAVLTGRDAPGAAFAIGELRLPRVLIALLAGAALGIGGRASQTMLRNQLASPDVIGVTSGSSAAAVVAILLWGWSGIAVNLLALGVGLGVALAILALAGRDGSQGGRIVLIGIGASAMFTAVTNYVQLRAKVQDLPEAMRWLSGSLASASWDQAPLLGGALLLLGVPLILLGRELELLRLGDDTAIGLGVDVPRSRLLVLLAVVGLSSFAAATTGPIAFVAFLAGPITTRLVGPNDSALLIESGLVGAALVLAADIAGQHLFWSVLPVGVVTGIIGAPALLLQIIALNRKGGLA